MANADLSQSEADELLAMAKVRADDQAYDYPSGGGSISVPLLSQDGRETFMLDINRGRIDLHKVTHQNRARQVIPLARLDLNGAAHTNPDGEYFPRGTPHLHLYREGYGDKWAFPVPTDVFPNLHSLWETLGDFMRYCHVVGPLQINQGLFE